MPTYHFEVSVTGTEYWFIEAENEEEARKNLFHKGEMDIAETDDVLDICLTNVEE